MKNIFKDNNYFNQSIMENDNFKYYFNLLTSSINLEEINKLVSPELYGSDNNSFSISSTLYLIKVENNSFIVYDSNKKPTNYGFINININKYDNGEELEISYNKKTREMRVNKIIGSNSFTVNANEGKNGVVYVDTQSTNNQIAFPKRMLRKTSK